MPEFRRKNIRLSASKYLGPQWYFVTTVVEGRAGRLQDAELVAKNRAILSSGAEKHYFAIAAYCFMPDHLHLLTNGTKENSNLLSFVDGFKQGSAFGFKQVTGERLWQKKFHDHILRSNERWESVACYIWMNPVRKGLRKRPEDWPYSGSFTVDWKKLMALGIESWAPPWKRELRAGSGPSESKATVPG